MNIDSGTNPGPHASRSGDNPYIRSDDAQEATLLDLWEVLWDQRILVAVITAVFAIGAVVVALLLTPIYRSESVLAPVDNNETTVASQLGNLASLAGIRLGASSDQNTTAVAVLRSRAFAESFIHDHDLIKVFFEDKWDPVEKRWLASSPEDEPTMFEAIKYFHESVFSVQEDPTDGLVTLAVEWKDPKTAAAWVNELVDRINIEARQRALTEAEQNLKYLRDQLAQASVVELRRAVSQLIENELNNEMLARVRKEYAFRVVDPGMIPTERARPHRTLIVVVSTVLGGLFAVFVALLRHSIRVQLRLRRSAKGLHEESKGGEMSP
jgi:uncharacterized protein involved in exopolysaccharide biosynthesis